MQDLGELAQIAQVGQGGLEGIAHLLRGLVHSHERELGEYPGEGGGSDLAAQALGQTQADQDVDSGRLLGGAHQGRLHHGGPGVGPLLDELPQARAGHEVGATDLAGQAHPDEAQAGEQLAALAVAGLAGRVQADAALRGIVEREAQGAESGAHLGHQRRTGGARRDSPEIGGGEDSGDSSPQIARQTGVVLDQAAGQGVQEIGASGPGAPAQRGQAQGLLDGDARLGRAQRLSRLAQSVDDVEDHRGGETARAGGRVGPPGGLRDAGAPGALPQTRGGHAGPVTAQRVQAGEVIADEPALPVGPRLGLGQPDGLGSGIESVEKRHGVKGPGDDDDRGAGSTATAFRLRQALAQSRGHDGLASVGGVRVEDLPLGVQTGQGRPGQGVGEEALPGADVGCAAVLEELLPDLVVVAAAQAPGQGVQGGGVGQVVLGLQGAGGASPGGSGGSAARAGIAVDEGDLGGVLAGPAQGDPFRGELGERVVGGGATGQREHRDRGDGGRILKSRQKGCVLGRPLDEDSSGPHLLQERAQGQGAGRRVVADRDEVDSAVGPGALSLQCAPQPGRERGGGRHGGAAGSHGRRRGV